jgi:hypothetical protein
VAVSALAGVSVAGVAIVSTTSSGITSSKLALFFLKKNNRLIFHVFI